MLNLAIAAAIGYVVGSFTGGWIKKLLSKIT